MVQQALKVFSHTKWLNQVLLPHPSPIRECHSLATDSVTLHSNVALWKVVSQATLGNSTAVCRHTRVWIVTDNVWDGGSGRHHRKRHRFDLFISLISASQPPHRISPLSKLQRGERTVFSVFQKQLTTEPPHCTYTGYTARVDPPIYRIWAVCSSTIMPRLFILVDTVVQWDIILWLWTASVWVITADHTTGLEHLEMLTDWQFFSGCESQY